MIPDPGGTPHYYTFQVMAYGCNPAVTIVTRLLRPIKAFLHRFGIKFTIYIDAGRICLLSRPPSTCISHAGSPACRLEDPLEENRPCSHTTPTPHGRQYWLSLQDQQHLRHQVVYSPALSLWCTTQGCISYAASCDGRCLSPPCIGPMGLWSVSWVNLYSSRLDSTYSFLAGLEVFSSHKPVKLSWYCWSSNSLGSMVPSFPALMPSPMCTLGYNNFNNLVTLTCWWLHNKILRHVY